MFDTLALALASSLCILPRTNENRAMLAKRSKFMCEHNGCRRLATIEWVMICDKTDAFPSISYTYRCAGHPVTDPDYEARIVDKSY